MIVSAWARRLAFRVNTLMSGFNIDSYAAEMGKQRRDPNDAQMLSNFAYIGLINFYSSPKPVIEIWDSFRE